MDVANPGVADDQQLMVRSMSENRVLITRDNRLAKDCRAAGAEFILIKSTKLLVQLNEMAEAGVKMELNPQRCTVCNGPLQEAVRCTGEQSLHERTWECLVCGKLYWAGSHWIRIDETLKQIRSGKSPIPKDKVPDQEFSLK